MAETKNGIKYPDNYDSVADIPSDLKKMAESIDKQIEKKVEKENGKGLSTNDFTNADKEKLDGLNNYDDTEIKEEISDIQEEQKIQNEDIETLKAEKEALEKEVQSLREDNRLNTLTEDNEGELINITNTTGARFNSLEIEGNEKQETREGYNLVNPLAKKNVGNNGVTVDFKEDGSIVFNGTSNGLGAWLISDDINYEPGEKYTMIVDIIKGTLTNSKLGWGMLAYPYVSENAIKILDTSSGRITKSFTFPSDTEISQKNIYLWFGETEEGATFDDFTIKIMIVKGENVVDKEFELYGSMPSFDYRSEIKTVGDNVNLFDKNSITADKYINGTLTSAINDYGDLINSTVTNTSDFMPVIKDQNYVFHFEYENLVSNNPRGYCFYNKEKQLIESDAETTYNPKNGKIQVSAKQDGYIRISYDKNCTNIKFEQGEKATGYSPFNQGAINLVISNKNLYKPNAESLTRLGVEYLVDIVKNTITAKRNEIASSGSYFGTGKLKLLAGTYIISGVDSTWIFSKARIEIYISNDTEESKLLTTLSGTRLNFTYTSDTPFYISFSIVITKETQIGESFTFKPQIEMGSIATDIVANEEQNYIIPVQQKMLSGDTFTKIDGSWKEVHTWQEVIFNGEENWLMNYGTSLFNFASNNIYNQSSTEHKALCNMAKFENRQAIMADLADKHFAMQVAYNSIFFKDSDFKTVEEFKAKLKELYEAGTPLKVAYKTDTPLILDCTPEQVAVLDKIEQEAHTYSEVTNVYTEDEVGAIIKTNTNINLRTMFNNMQAQILAE